MRANMSLIILLHEYGKELDEPPREFMEKTLIYLPNILPETSAKLQFSCCLFGLNALFRLPRKPTSPEDCLNL